MKKIIIVDASPRKGGNSDVVTDKLCAEIKNADVEVFKIREKTVNPCHGCDACKGRDKAGCVQKDDIGALISRIDESDAVVLNTPIYFGQVSAQAKMFIDRMYCFFDPGKPSMTNAYKSNRKTALICTCGDGSGAYDKYAEETVHCMDTIGVAESRSLVCGGINGLGECKEKPEYMKSIGEIADWLSK